MSNKHDWALINIFSLPERKGLFPFGKAFANRIHNMGYEEIILLYNEKTEGVAAKFYGPLSNTGKPTRVTPIEGLVRFSPENFRNDIEELINLKRRQEHPFGLYIPLPDDIPVLLRLMGFISPEEVEKISEKEGVLEKSIFPFGVGLAINRFEFAKKPLSLVSETIENLEKRFAI